MKEIKKITHIGHPYQKIRGGFILNISIGLSLLVIFIIIIHFVFSFQHYLRRLYSLGSYYLVGFLIQSAIDISEKINPIEFVQQIKKVSDQTIPDEIETLINILNVVLFAIIIGGFIPVILGLFATTLVRHLVLRYFLWREGSTPLKYATFLDYAAEARILEKDGGQWRFRHQNLQEYFANLKD